MESRWLSLSLLLLSLCQYGLATKAVFAHFIVSNADGWDQSQWESEMQDAQAVNIDAFALNIAADQDVNADQVPLAFAAAASTGFQVFFSFDYAGNGAWAESDVLDYLEQYIGESVYFLHDGSLPLVSTFEGPANAADWVTIKSTYSIFFIPDWSSLGAEAAIELEDGVADGLFSWAAWSWGGNSMDTYTDASYIQFLGGKPFMMAASPWFYTNLPEYNKNWMWPQEDMNLWATRWTQILYLQPDYVEIISWNDFGESHYIGNNPSSAPAYFTGSEAVYDYATEVPHDPLRWPLAVWADQYKNDVSTVTTESLLLMYLTDDIDSCDTGETPVNTATQLQYEYIADDVLASNYKYIGFIATLASSANISITVGGTAMAATFQYTPVDDVGVYYGSLYIGDLTGDVSAGLLRNDESFLTVDGEPIGGCTDGYMNFNIWVSGTQGDSDSVSATTTNTADLVCISGTGANWYTDEDFGGICGVTCEYGYCPSTACVCTQIGKQKEYPDVVGAKGYASYDANFIGLCSWMYNYGFGDIVTDECTTTETDPPVLDWNPFLPPTCTAGEINPDSDYAVDDLCTWGCSHGYCPSGICTCTAQGLLVLAEETNTYESNYSGIYPADGNMWASNVCDFPCENYGLCVCDYPETSLECNINITYSSLDSLLAVSQEYDFYCNELSVLWWLAENMTDVLSSYNSMVSNGYSSYFDDYVTYVKDEVNPVIEQFMVANGTSYFSCVDKYNDETVDCYAWSSLTAEDDGSVDMAWTLEDADGFNAVLLGVYGINSTWVEYGTKTESNSCSEEQCGISGYTWTFTGYPISVSSDDITVYNPASVFTSAGDGLTDLPVQILATYMDMITGQWGNGSALDVIQVYSTATSSAAQALQAMDTVETIAKEIEQAESDEKKKNMILWIVTAVLFFVPYVGEEIFAALDFTALSSALAMAGVAGNLGLDVYTIVEDPSSAYMVVMGWLVGAGGVAALDRDADSFAKMAVRRESDLSEVTDLGTIAEDVASDIESIALSCEK